MWDACIYNDIQVYESVLDFVSVVWFIIVSVWSDGNYPAWIDAMTPLGGEKTRIMNTSILDVIGI